MSGEPETLHLVDWTGFDLESIGQRLVERTAGDVDAQALRRMVDNHLRQLPEDVREPMRQVVSILADHLGHTTAIARAQAQAVEIARRTREARLRVDPLPQIAAMFGVGLTQPNHVDISVESGNFVGFNWHRLEKNGDQVWRWAYPELTSSVVLPRVAGGRLEVSIRFILPFGAEASATTLAAMLDGVPVEFSERRNTVFTGSVDLPDDLAATRMALVISSAGHVDPRVGANRDPRTLGIGLNSVSVKRISAR